MPVMKYSEIALAAAFAIFTFAAWLVEPPAVRSKSAASRPAVPPMIVVVITGKRMTPEEKRLSSASDI